MASNCLLAPAGDESAESSLAKIQKNQHQTTKGEKL